MRAKFNDMMTDGTQTYWMDKRYTKENDAEWYWRTSKGKYFSGYGDVMRDESIKGLLTTEYKLSN